jgi:hypothetical protein
VVELKIEGAQLVCELEHLLDTHQYPAAVEVARKAIDVWNKVRKREKVEVFFPYS